jgi:hypothetical protein
MTQPPTTPGPDEPGAPQPPSGESPPPGGSPFASPGDGAPAMPPAPQYDPSQSYVVYQAVPSAYGPPTTGYGVPSAGLQAGYDPMISPDYSGWWQRSISIFRQAWKQLLVLQFIGFLAGLLVAVPAAIYGFTVLDDLTRTTQTSSTATPDLSPLLGVLVLVLVGAVAASLVAAAVTVASNHIAVSVAAGLEPRVGAALSLAARRFLPVWGWQLLASLIMLVGICACILPGLYLYAVFLILPAVVTFERGGSGVGRCFQLFHRDFGSAVARAATIAGVLIVASVVSYLVGQVIEAAGGAVTYAADDIGNDRGIPVAVLAAIVVSAVVSALISAGVKMFTDVLVVTAYADMRARYETLSTATLAGEIGLTPPAATQWVAPPAA